ncbi:hypothetical protein B0H14DRAFT_3429781 [Mycena olivaceomarginata]|nr:hypothetical protein B0H14DRAFT_3429781 [Mycena olivaceomarginata]
MSLPVPAIVPPAPQINATVLSAPAGEIFTGYISDISSGESGDSGKEDPGEAPSVGNADESTPVQDAETLASPPSTGSVEEPRYHRVQPVPPLRRTKFAVPQAERRRIQIAQTTAARANILASALTAIDKLIASKKTSSSHGGEESKLWKPASETAAEARGFETTWGGRMVHKWTRNWISDRVIPESKIGNTASRTRFTTTP